MEIFKPLSPCGKFTHRCKISDVLDRGKGAVFVLDGKSTLVYLYCPLWQFEYFVAMDNSLFYFRVVHIFNDIVNVFCTVTRIACDLTLLYFCTNLL